MKNSKAWVLLFGCLALLCAVLIARQRLSGTAGITAEIYQNGTLLHTIYLNEARSITVPAPNGGFNTVSIESGRVCVSHASCPDQVCVRQGWVSQSSIPIVCLPNQLVIQIKGGESHLDAATG